MGHLGPHALGQRVVVRRTIPGVAGPTGGPAFTDVLGVLERWDTSPGGLAVVRREDGESVTFPIALVVSGKPVPPRASPRQRVSVLAAEQHTAGLFPDIEVERLGEWQLRHQPAPAGRRRKRANSCLAVGDPHVPIDEAAAAVADHYARLGLPPLVQVEQGSETEVLLAERGWAVVPGGDAHFLLGSLVRARRALRSAGPPPGPEVGRAEGHLDGDWFGIHDLHVEPEHRRQGHARALVADLLESAAEQGATTVWLHVETDNQPALTLYEGLGLTVHHTCRYLAAPA